LIRVSRRQMAADTFALVSFAFVVGMVVEILVSGLTFHQSLQSRLLAIPLKLVDITAFSTFMMPQYAAVLGWVGADWGQIAVACGTVAAMSIAVGRPYGLYLVFCRRLLERIRL